MQNWIAGRDELTNNQRRLLYDELLVYAKKFPHEVPTVHRFLSFLESEPNCFNRSTLHGHITCGVWLLSPTADSVLLTHHKKLGVWMQLGGHADGNGCPTEVALTEGKEESGISEIALVHSDIFDVDIHLIPSANDVPEHLHYDIRYLCKAATLRYTVSSESHDLAWVTYEQIPQYSSEPSILRMAEKWQSLL